jgi:hypothetical protein
MGYFAKKETASCGDQSVPRTSSHTGMYATVDNFIDILKVNFVV